MLQEALRLLGFTTPFIYAATTYGFFHYLDKKASGQAKRAISAWINSAYIDKRQTSAIAVEIFDRVYTAPLWGRRAIGRSLLFTTAIIILGVLHIYPALFWLIGKVPFSFHIGWGVRILCNYVGDYLSLYLIRRCLILGGAKPLVATLSAPLIGVAVLLVLLTIADVIRFSIQTWSFGPIYFLQGGLFWIRSLTEGISAGSKAAILFPALIIHLWLPLFAAGVLLAQLVNYFFKASSWTQWFLKRGRDHPLDAIGYVAAVIVFVGTAVFQVLRT